MTFHRATGHYLGSPRGPRHPFPPAVTHPPPHPVQHHRRGGSSSGGASRQHPYGMRNNAAAAARRGPTSAPAGAQSTQGQGGNADTGGEEARSALAVGMQGHVERMRRECDGLSELVGRESGGGGGGELERRRQEKRGRNFGVAEMEERLEALPRALQRETGVEAVPWDVPLNGAGIRNLDHDSISTLLNVYGISFQADMFLAQKKELYLRFIGANRALMHRVLD
ncbi:hypothetical protein GTA08_BOTSDO08013 [Neofusicoccum parvum]|nr:hypothetical protein GTA08_BOTSDO08013 [Neofusicoccum parvum]